MDGATVRHAAHGGFGSFRYDPQTDRYTFDEGARSVLGDAAHESATYNDMLARMPAAARRDYEMWRHETIESGRAASVRVPFHPTAGREIMLEVHLHATGNIVQGLVLDVTEDDKRRREDEAQLRLMTFAERTARFGSWRYDIKRDLFWGSPGAATLWTFGDANLAPGAALPAALDLVHPDDRPSVADAIERAATTGQGVRVDFRPSSDPDRWMATTAIRVLDHDGEPAALYGIVMDVTAQHERETLHRQALRLTEREETRVRFVSAAAHELSQPMIPLRLRLATLMRRGPNDPEAMRSYEIMDRNLDRLQLMLQDLLDAARIQAGRLMLASGTVAVNDALTWIIDTLAPFAEEREVAVNWQPGPDATVAVDGMRLQQCLSNLVHNAIKFSSPDGTVTIHLEHAPTTVRIAVTDSGPGLDEKQVARLFQPFEQIHQPPPGTGGTGLGLYITRSIVEAFGGTIEVASAPGAGSTFTLVLPLQPAEAANDPPAPAP